jgi:hypothetical protein
MRRGVVILSVIPRTIAPLASECSEKADAVEMIALVLTGGGR